MGHVEDRWTTPGPNGRIKSPRHGQGSRWLAVWHEPGGQRRKRAFPVKDAALAHLEHVGVETRTGTYITRDRGAITVAQMAERWTAAHADWAVSTRTRNTDILRVHVLPRWGPMRLDEVSDEAVQDWVNAMPGSANTRRRHHQVLSGILTLAVKRKRIPVNPAIGVTFPPADARAKGAMSVPEVDAFVEAHPERWRTWARFLAFTGLRVSEAAGLRVRHVDLDRGRVRVEEAVVLVNGRKVEQNRVKTVTSGRSVPLVAELIPLLRPLVVGRDPDERLFVVGRGASVNRANYGRREFKAAVVAIGRPEMTPHELRHTAVSLAIASGASVKAVQAIAGHKDASMTLNVYSHLFADDLDSVSVRMGAHINRARKAARRSGVEPGSPRAAPKPTG